MKKSTFVHLHNHSEYSFLDGAIRVKDMVKRAAEFGMPALALTDHGGMFGAVEFYNACMSAGIKPIMGFEAYVAPNSRLDKTRSSGEDNYHHLILLARNTEGYHNLLKMSSIGYLEGFYYKPRIDMEVLRAHSSGIIATSACVGGAIPRAILDNRLDKAEAIAAEYVSIFGAENFYFELQKHGIDKEIIAFEQMIALGKKMGIPFIVANDAHYLNREDAASHEVLLCIQTQATMADPGRYRFGSDQIYFKSPAEMEILFPEMPEAMTNTMVIAERCNVEIKSKPQLPKPGFPQGFTSESEFLRHCAHIGLKEKYAHITPGLLERLEFELKIICEMGFEGYFLVVADFMRAAAERHVMTGCRGSAAGSLVAYVVGITSVDPIHFDLLFERFLNPERVSMPDADIDFADKDRYKIIDYVKEKYGQESVCQIVNFGRMKAKMAVRDVARVMGLAAAESGKLAGMVEDSLDKSVAGNGELADLLKQNTTYAEIFKHARVLEGLARQPGMHAGGVIIAPGKVVHWAPLFKQSGADLVMTQYDMKYVEEVGLIKMDFLGLRTLTVLQDALILIKKYHDIDIDLWKLVDRDQKTMDLFGRAETVGVFQFESQGMQDNLRKLKPEGVDDLIAMNALYRPGPMDEIPVYIRRKHGHEKVKYEHPLLEDILKITYGVMIYQEQVMRIAQAMGGFSLGQADILRKAMGKKDLDKMEQMRKKFMEGATQRDVPEKVAQEIFDRMAKFAQYAFNKAHATVYAHVAYQSGYLKAHYPIEFMTAYMSSVITDQDEVLTIKNEAERMGISILPPDVNTSEAECSIVDGKLVLGLATIKNVGKSAESILEARKTKKKFSGIFELCASVDIRLVNKKCLESLVYAGAMDSLRGTRAQLFASIDKAIDYGQSYQKDRLSGQTNLFEMFGGGGAADQAVSIPEPSLAAVPPWPYNELLQREKEVLNFYVSGHPLDRYREEIRGFSTIALKPENLKKTKEGSALTLGGVITVCKLFTQRDGRSMAFLTLEDFDGAIELLAFGDVYEKFKHLLAVDSMVLVHGTVTIRDTDVNPAPKLRLDNIMALADSRDKLTKSVHLRIMTSGLEEEYIKEVQQMVCAQKGECALILHIVTTQNNDYKLRSRSCRISPKHETLELFYEKLGKENVWISKSSE